MTGNLLPLLAAGAGGLIASCPNHAQAEAMSHEEITVAALFLTYFFMSIMFPTIFSLGIHGLGARAKKASSFIVMAIMGGAIMPKFMGHIGDVHGMSVAFIVPLICFILIALSSFAWPKLVRGEAEAVLDPARAH